MHLFKAIWQFLKQVAPIGKNEEAILREAQNAMERELAWAKKRVVASIGHRNALRIKLEARQRQVNHPELFITDPQIAELRHALEEAEQETAVVKDSILSIHAQARLQAAERLARLGLKQAEITERLNSALPRPSLDGLDEAIWHARERIRRLQDESR